MFRCLLYLFVLSISLISTGGFLTGSNRRRMIGSAEDFPKKDFENLIKLSFKSFINNELSKKNQGNGNEVMEYKHYICGSKQVRLFSLCNVFYYV